MKLALILAVVGFLFAPLPARAADAARVRIVLAGDSTVTDKAGWGLGFSKALNDSVELVNLSRGGRSSRSFRDEGLWKQVLAARPHYVLIQFGHNDQPGKGPQRETDPKTTYRQNLARYVDEARAIGAQPVLVTSMSRRRWADDGIHIRSDLLPYVEAARAVAAEKGVPLIDLHERSIEVYELLGQKGCELISPKNDDGTTDATHLNVAGGEIIGPLMARELHRAVPELKPHVRGYIPAEPTTVPTTAPTTAPTTVPTTAPTTAPTTVPTTVPTTAPTTVPTAVPTTRGAAAFPAPHSPAGRSPA